MTISVTSLVLKWNRVSDRKRSYRYCKTSAWFGITSQIRWKYRIFTNAHGDLVFLSFVTYVNPFILHRYLSISFSHFNDPRYSLATVSMKCLCLLFMWIGNVTYDHCPEIAKNMLLQNSRYWVLLRYNNRLWRSPNFKFNVTHANPHPLFRYRCIFNLFYSHSAKLKWDANLSSLWLYQWHHWH